MTNSLDIFFPDFIIIPIQVYRNQDLEQLDRLVFGVVYWYAQLKDGKCFASNKAIAEVLEVHPDSIRNSLERLEMCSLIRRIFKDEGRRHRTEIECLLAFRWMGQNRVAKSNMMGLQTHHDGPTDPSLPMRNNKEEEDVQAGDDLTHRETPLEASRLKQFEELWNTYPRRRGRKAACRHFKAEVKTSEDFEAIKSALQNYLKEIKRLKTDPQYILHGSTWFNNWRDYVPTAAVLDPEEDFHPIPLYPAKEVNS